MIAVLVVMAVPVPALAQCQWGDLMGTPPAANDPVGRFMAQVQAAAALVEAEPDPAPATGYSDLERAILAALDQQSDAPCGTPALLGISLADGRPAPGFTEGREESYAIALDVLQRYDYTLLDEDPVSDAIDDEWPLEGNVRAAWKPAELARLRVVLDTFAPWFGDLDLKVIIRDDFGQVRTPDGPHLFQVGGTYWMEQELSPATGSRPGSPRELRMYNDSRPIGCFEKLLVHELMHAWMDKHDGVQSAFNQRVGWKPYRQGPSTTRITDCRGREYPIESIAWRRPARSADPPDPKYHDQNGYEDAAEQFSYRIMGASADALAQLNTDPTDLEDCTSYLDSDRPEPEAVIEKLMRENFGDEMFLRTNPWQGIRLGVSTPKELEAASGVKWSRRGNLMVREIGGDPIERLEATTHNGHVMSIRNVFNDGPTVAELIAKYGEPSYRDDGRLVWTERLLAAELDGDRARSLTYGLFQPRPTTNSGPDRPGRRGPR